MKLAIKKATTDVTVYIFVQNSSVTTGAGLTGLAFNTASLTAYYVRPLGSATAITLATQTVTGAHSDGGFVEVDATNMPGVYRLDLPDAVCATGVNSVVVMLKGATNMAPVLLEAQLTTFDLNDASPEVTLAAETHTGAVIPTVTDVTNQVSANVTAVSGDSAAADNLEADYDGTGYNKSASTIGTCTTNTDMRGTDNALLAASAPTNFGDLAITATTGRVTVGTNTDKTGYSISGTKTTLDALQDITAAQVNAEADAALADIHLDHLLAADYDPAAKPGVATALLNELVGNDAGVSQFTANALELAPTGGSAPSAADIRTEIDANSTQLAAIVADTNELQADWTNGGRLDLIIDAILADTNELQSDDVPTLITALENLSAAQVNAQVVDALATDTYAEPGSVPAATATLAAKIGWIYVLARNKVTQTSTTQAVRNDADAANVATAAVSDDGTTSIRGEWS